MTKIVIKSNEHNIEGTLFCHKLKRFDRDGIHNHFQGYDLRGNCTQNQN